MKIKAIKPKNALVKPGTEYEVTGFVVDVGKGLFVSVDIDDAEVLVNENEETVESNPS